MHNAIAHHSPTNAELVPEQQSPPGQLPPVYTGHDITWCGIPLWPVWVSCPGCVPSQLLVPLQLSLWLGIRSRKILDFRLNISWQQLKISVCYRHSSQTESETSATRKKINFIPAKTRTKRERKNNQRIE